MAEDNKIILDKENEEILIQNLKISSPEVYNFLKDKENLEDWAKKALIIGCVGLRQMVLTENVDFVEKEFNKFIIKAKEVFEKQTCNFNDKIDTTFSLSNTQSPLFQMKELIDEYFNKDKGQIRNIIDETFNIDNKKSALSLLIEELRKNSEMDEKKLHELLDSNKTDSPARYLKEQILEKLNDMRDKEIKDIRDEVLKKSAIDEVKQRGTEKGFEFEEEVYSTLQTLASYYENTIELIGEKSGVGSKKGDVLIELENKKKIVVECKDSSSYSTKKTIDEINEAIQNRNAVFGIFLFAKRDLMPRELCPIKITDKYIITYYDEDNLYFAYRIARLFALKEIIGSEECVDFDKISSELNTMEDNFKNIDAMQIKATTIINSGEYIRKNLNLLRNNIDESVKKIKREMGGKYKEE
ncbi:hypothetical protein KAI04_00735 [Candidatus Pacearchaeota archaeon]|nr:hypothetical protein [Candidatus Pacearchaeota archaeon]